MNVQEIMGFVEAQMAQEADKMLVAEGHGDMAAKLVAHAKWNAFATVKGFIVSGEHPLRAGKEGGK